MYNKVYAVLVHVAAYQGTFAAVGYNSFSGPHVTAVQYLKQISALGDMHTLKRADGILWKS